MLSMKRVVIESKLLEVRRDGHYVYLSKKGWKVVKNMRGVGDNSVVYQCFGREFEGNGQGVLLCSQGWGQGLHCATLL